MMFLNFSPKKIFVTSITLALLLDASFSAQVKAESFRFLFEFPSGGTLKGRVEGDLLPQTNIVSNLSNLFAVYYAPVIPPFNTGVVPNQPIVFNTLISGSQFTLDGGEGIDFSGKDSTGNFEFNIYNDFSFSFADVNYFDGQIFENIDGCFGSSCSQVALTNNNEFSSLSTLETTNNLPSPGSFADEQDLAEANPTGFPFSALQNDREMFISGDLDEITTNADFPDAGAIEGYLFYDSPFPTPNSILGGFDYNIDDFLLVFSDESGNPKEALVPPGSGTFNAVNPGKANVTGQTNPTNPSTFELTMQWDIGYTNPSDVNEVFGENGTVGQFQPEVSSFIFYDANGEDEAVYGISNGTLNTQPGVEIPEPSSILGLASIAGLGFLGKKKLNKNNS